MIMDPNLTHLLYFIVYQVFPYVVITVWLVGSFIRFLTHPYTVKSQSSELLGGKKEINWGARLFHAGVIFLLFGHLFGLFVPKQFLADVGITPHMNQMIEIVAGGACAVLCLVGIALMIHRRITNPRIRKTSRPSDWLVLVLIAGVLIMGATCVINAMLFDQSGEGLFDFVNWAIALVTLQPDAYTYLIDAATPQKIHIFIGLCIFLVVPFTRLIHIWSGYASPIYLLRNMQKMRMNGAPMGDDLPAHTMERSAD